MAPTIRSTLIYLFSAVALPWAAYAGSNWAYAVGPAVLSARSYPLSLVAHSLAQEAHTGTGRMNPIEDLIDAERLQEARTRLKEEIKNRGEDYRTAYLEAKILFKERRFLYSLKKLEASFALGGRHSEVYKLVALNAIALGRVDIAESNLKIAAQLAPDDDDVHYRLGVLYFLSDRFALCESEMHRVVELRPTLMLAHDILGLALEELGEDEAAIDAYRKAIELTRQQHLKDEKAYLHLGKFLERNGRYREGLPLLQNAVALNPSSAEGFFLLGKVHSHLGDDQKAEWALGRAVQIDPDYPDPYYLLSRIHLKQGRQKEAEREKQLYLKTKEHQRLRENDGRHAVR